jgi:hypothetical protein
MARRDNHSYPEATDYASDFQHKRAMALNRCNLLRGRPVDHAPRPAPNEPKQLALHSAGK